MGRRSTSVGMACPGEAAGRLEMSLSVWTLLKDIQDEPDWLAALTLMNEGPCPIWDMAARLSCTEGRAREVMYDLVWEELAELPDGITCRLAEKGLACITQIMGL